MIKIQALSESISQQEKKKKEAETAFQSWKEKKEERMKSTGKMFTFHPNPREPPKSCKWCPARTVKYDYPADEQADSIVKMLTLKKIKPQTPGRHTKRSLEKTYSVESFDSDKELSDEDIAVS